MNIKNFIMGIAIMVLMVFVIIYGINSFYGEAPEYEDFCDFERPVPLPKGEVCPSVCIQLYSIVGEECVFDECGSGCGADGISSFETLKECEDSLEKANCYEELEKAREEYYKNLFFIALFVGIGLIVVGAFLFKLESVGAGIMGGGVITILYGVGGYWRYSNNLARFLFSLAGLGIVVGVAYWFNRKMGKGR